MEITRGNSGSNPKPAIMSQSQNYFFSFNIYYTCSSRSKHTQADVLCMSSHVTSIWTYVRYALRNKKNKVLWTKKKMRECMQKAWWYGLWKTIPTRSVKKWMRLTLCDSRVTRYWVIISELVCLTNSTFYCSGLDLQWVPHTSDLMSSYV